MTEWLAGLQKGDTVMVETRGTFAYSLRVGVVEKATKAQVVLNDGERYNRQTGQKIGSSGHIRPFICPVDNDRLLKHEQGVVHQREVRAMREYSWAKLTLEQLTQVKALLAQMESQGQ